MMRIVATLLLLYIAVPALAQKELQEKLFVHVDRSLYQTGETMWFKIYSVDGTLHKPLDFSIVAYLEVIDNSNNPILQTKVQLKNGKGNGSLLLPPSVNTGNYVVRAYTNWMKNFSPEFYYHQSITIINVMRNPVEDNVAQTANPGDSVRASALQRQPGSSVETLAIEAKLNSDQYNTRTKVGIELSTKSIPANLSVSVFKLDSLPNDNAADITTYLLTSDLFAPKENKIQYMPELRGHIITANIIDELTNAPAPQIETFLSTPGNGVRLYASRSDDRGEVMFDVKDLTDQNKIVLQTNLLKDSTYKIQLNNPFSTSFSSYRAPAFQSAAYAKSRERILSQSIHSQIQYIFYSDSVRSSKVKKDTAAFYGQPNKHYKLDDYTRFTSMEDVMREYVAGLTVRKKAGKLQFSVLDELTGVSFKGYSISLVDGVPIFNTQKIIGFDPLKVQSLDVITRRYFIGSAIFDGLVSYRTYTGDLAGFPLDSKVLVHNYEGVQAKREFYSPQYNTSQQVESRLPDFRDLLYWNPDVNITDGKAHLEFYTSDQPGTYKVVIQGISSQGIPGQTSFTFDVNPLER